MKVLRGRRDSSILSLTSAVDGGEWLKPHPGHFAPGKKTGHPFYKRLGGSTLMVWKGAENLAPKGIGFLNRPARSESLYRLSYPGPLITLTIRIKKIKYRNTNIVLHRQIT
jgi:hypothetical protein